MRIDRLNLRKNASVLLGILGIINSAALGLYIFLTLNALTFVNAEFRVRSYVGGGLGTVCAGLLLLGTIFVWKRGFIVGGVLNLASGVILLSTLAYFAYFADLQILRWLEPFGFFLAVPQLLSGLMAITSEAAI